MILSNLVAAAALAALAGAASGASPTGGPNAEEKAIILALRADNNRAIAAHDLDGVTRLLADDYVFTGGDDGTERSAAEDRKGWADEFAQPGMDRYVRTATELEVGERKGVFRAAEGGTWEGTFHLPAGDAHPFGRYFVHWSKASGQWRMVSESYVTLGCRGPGC
jgi:ketosteroid isomerase-like protein